MYCTLEAVKRLLDITGSEKDDELYGLMLSVKSEIDDYCDRSFGKETATRYFDGIGNNLVVDDIVSVSALKLDLDGDGVYEKTMASDDYVLWPYNESPKWMIKLSYDSDYSSFACGIPRGVEIAGVWGYSSVPRAVQQSAIEMTCRAYRQSQGSYGTEIGTPDIGTTTVFQGMSADVRRKLNPFVRRTFG